MAQVKIVIHPNPQGLLDRLEERHISPYSLEGFGVHPGSAMGYLRTWLERILEQEPEYRVKMLSGQPDPEQTNRTVYKAETLTDGRGATGAAVIFVHPALAHYDKVLGFEPNTGKAFPETDSIDLGDNTDRPDESYGYRLEGYEPHIERVFGEFRDYTWREIAYAAAQLERKYPQWLPPKSVHLAAQLAVLLHDTGKLNVKWQEWATGWQRFIGRMDDVQEGAAYAHTDNFSPAHREMERAFRKEAYRPPHAVEGAIAASQVLSDALNRQEYLIRAAWTAIARHHTPDADTLQKPVRLESGALRRTQALLKQHMPDVAVKVTFPTEKEQREIDIRELAPAQRDGLVLHFLTMLLVRALRRADQRGTGLGTVKG